MKIVAPVSKTTEVAMLAANGAREFYCGFVPPEWVKRFGWGEALNRRLTATANVRTWESLEEILAEAHDRRLPVYVTLNAPAYRSGAARAVEEIAVGLSEAGADGIIVADPDLVLRLGDLGLSGEIHLSSVAAARNRASLELFAEIGVRRVILPRQVTIEEVRTLRRSAPGLTLEAFVLNDTCIFDEGFCFTSHAACSVRVLCRRPFEMEPIEAGTGKPLEEGRRDLWQEQITDWRRFVRAAGGTGFAPSHVPESPCGLCAIPALLEAGVDAIKVVGREASSLRKLRSVQAVRAILEHALSGHGEPETIAHAIAVRATPEVCREGYLCYYRDVHRDRVMPVLDGET